MSTQNENLFVKLIKKSVGLPTGKSDCCGMPTGQSGDCCGAGESSECCGKSSSGCGCGSEGCGEGCCGAEDEIESEMSPVIASSAI